MSPNFGLREELIAFGRPIGELVMERMGMTHEC